jgi:hypothetical protein
VKAAKLDAKLRLRAQLERLRHSKDPFDPANAGAALKALQRWQQQRLAKSYEDLRAHLRFKPACDFFIEQLYGPQDFTKRDQDIERIFPIMVRLLPAPVLGTVARAVELDAISHELDRALCDHLLARGIAIDTLSQNEYALSYTGSAPMEKRRHQLALLLLLGRELDRLVKKPLLWDLLRMCRWPARLAGLAELQSFLERGFDAFKRLHGAGPFLRAIGQRELLFMRQLRSMTQLESRLM